MKWLTIFQIKRRSKTAKGALKVSYEHWCQLYDATAKELREKCQIEDMELHRGAFCGLCKYIKEKYGYCRCMDCVLGKFCENPLWYEANNTLRAWYFKDNSNWHAWKRACKALRDKLKELLEQGSKL